MTPVITLRKIRENLDVHTPKLQFYKYFKCHAINKINIRAPVLLTLFNSLRKIYKMLGKPRILYLFPNSFNKINKT